MLQDLGRAGGGDRHSALVELAGIVAVLPLEDLHERIRQPLRLKIPTVLDKAIKRRVKETGQTYLAVLVEAAREYHRRHAARKR